MPGCIPFRFHTAVLSFMRHAQVLCSSFQKSVGLLPVSARWNARPRGPPLPSAGRLLLASQERYSETLFESILNLFDQSNELLPWDHDIATESVTLSICGEEHTTSSWHSDISFTVRIIEGGHFWWGHHRLWREEPSAAVLGESSRFRQVVTTLPSLKIQTLLNWGRLEQVAKMGGAPADNFQTVGDRCW